MSRFRDWLARAGLKIDRDIPKDEESVLCCMTVASGIPPAVPSAYGFCDGCGDEIYFSGIR